MECGTPKAGTGARKGRTPSAAPPGPLVSRASGTALQKQRSGCSGCSHGLWRPPGAPSRAPTLATASDSPAAVQEERGKREGSVAGFHGAFLCLAVGRAQLQNGAHPAGPCSPSLKVSHSLSPNLPGCATLGCSKLPPLPLGEQAACSAGAHHTPSPHALALVGFHTVVCRGWGGGSDLLPGNPQVLAKLKIPKICPLPFSAARLREREGSKQLLLPNMGLTASDEATAEACRHPAGRFKGPGSSQGRGQDPAGIGAGNGSFPRPVSCSSPGTVGSQVFPRRGSVLPHSTHPRHMCPTPLPCPSLGWGWGEPTGCPSQDDRRKLPE